MSANLSNSTNPFVRRGNQYSLRVQKKLVQFGGRGDSAGLPPILVNSLPKSGTHLLTQVVGALPSSKDWGTFLVSSPSLTMREVPADRMARRIARLMPGEAAKGHLYWSPTSAAALRGRQACSLFIYRDPRDVAASEAHYLANMNRWHRMHREYAALRDPAKQLLLSIRGRKDDDGSASVSYPDIGRRVSNYLGWIADPSTLAVRFEELTDPRRVDDVIEQIVRSYAGLAGRHVQDANFDVKTSAARCRASIDPRRSHTFREGGGKETWRRTFSEEHVRAFKDVAGELLIDLGYENDMDWTV